MSEGQYWEQKLRKFDETGVMSRFCNSAPKLIESAVRGRKADEVINEENWQKHVYNGTYDTSFEGWPVTIEFAQVGVRTPEYLATRRRGWNADDIRKSWGCVNEQRIYKGNVSARIGRIDNKRELVIKTESALGADYGEFFGIIKKDCCVWPDAKFNYRTNGPWPGDFAGNELYQYVDGLIQLSQAGDCGITSKDIWYNLKTGRISLANHQHVYPNIEDGLYNSHIERQKVHRIYDKGKELWEDKFTINAEDRGSASLKMMFDAIGRRDSQPVTQKYGLK